VTDPTPRPATEDDLKIICTKGCSLLHRFETGDGETIAAELFEWADRMQQHFSDLPSRVLLQTVRAQMEERIEERRAWLRSLGAFK
jgi:hypothetical protein